MKSFLNPFEILGGLRFRSSRDFLVTAGGGAGLTAGYGAPKYRVLLSMQYAPVTRRLRATASRSAESIVIEVPEPKDFDGFQDTVGCPERDNDRDGIADLTDKCREVHQRHQRRRRRPRRCSATISRQLERSPSRTEADAEADRRAG